MSETITEKSCDLLVIGAGVAGMAAALFAVNRGLDVIQVGSVSELNFASGLLDLLAVHPIEAGRVWDDPWAALKKLAEDEPLHPYARLDPEQMAGAFREFVECLDEADQPYVIRPERNTSVITHLGTLKTTYAVPRSMYGAAAAYESGQDCLLVGFHGLRGFSSRLIAENLRRCWTGRLRYDTVSVPGEKGELYNEPLARSLENPSKLQSLAEAVAPAIRGDEAVGLPAVLGVKEVRRVHREMEAILGRPVFEIPTMLPSVTGMRLREGFASRLRARGVDAVHQAKVIGFERDSAGGFVFQVGGEKPQSIVKAKAAILATGRFFGRGLEADRRRVRETVFGLPVSQPPDRDGWYLRDYFSLAGHGINRAGVEIDGRFRPVGPDGRPVYENLFAAGSILARQDWKRQKCGGGLAITTAMAAVQAGLSHLL